MARKPPKHRLAAQETAEQADERVQDAWGRMKKSVKARYEPLEGQLTEIQSDLDEIKKSLDEIKKSLDAIMHKVNGLGAKKGDLARGVQEQSVQAQALQAPRVEAHEIQAQGEQGTSPGHVGDVLGEFSPTKPFENLKEAIRESKPVSALDWLWLLGDIALEVAAWIPSPAAPVARALRFARVGSKVAKMIAKGVRLGAKVGKAVDQSRAAEVARAAEGAGRRAIEGLNRIHVEVRSTPGKKHSMQEIAATADQVKIPAGQEEQAAVPSQEELLERLDKIVPPSDPIGGAMRRAVSNRSRYSLLAARAERRGLAEDLEQYVARRRDPDLLGRIIDRASSLFLQEDSPSFLDDDALLEGLADELVLNP